MLSLFDNEERDQNRKSACISEPLSHLPRLSSLTSKDDNFHIMTE